MVFQRQTCRSSGGPPSSPNPLRFGFLVSIVACASALCPGIGVAGTDVPDSLRNYHLDSIVVSAPRIPQSSAPYAFAREIAFDAAQSGQSLAHLLESLPGALVRDYGGTGALATVSWRGMDPSETVVLLDGIRLNGLQHGMVDLNKIPLGGFSGASIAASDAGFDEPAGGVLSLHSAPLGRDLAGAFTAGTGSFGDRVIAATLGAGSATLAGSLGVTQASAVNDFSYDWNGEQRTRVNADFTMRSLYGRAMWVPGANASAFSPRHDLLLNAVESDQGTPGAATGTASTARQHDRTVTAQVRSQWLDSPAAQLETSVAGLYTDETYSGLTWNNAYRTRSLAIAGRGTTMILPGIDLHAGIRETIGEARSSDLADATRFETQALLGPEITLPPSLLFERVRLQVLGRCDIAADHMDGGASITRSLITISAGAGATLRDLPALTMRAFVATTGRMPTFNDLYWNPGGNPDLRTERGTKAEIGARMDVQQAGAWTLDGSAYYIDSRDKIVWLPLNGTIWSPRNVRHVIAKGVTATMAWSPATWITLQAAEDISSHVRAEAEFPGDDAVNKQLPYIPLETTSASLFLRVIDGAVTADATVLRNSHRFTSTDNSSFLPGYTTLDAGVAGRLILAGFTLRPSLRCLNITGAAYQILDGYPMPGRSVHVSVTTEFNDR